MEKTQRKYLLKTTLKIFVEELGHEYLSLFNEAVKEENEVDVTVCDGDEILLQAAKDQIKASAWNDDGSEDEDGHSYKS